MEIIFYGFVGMIMMADIFLTVLIWPHVIISRLWARKLSRTALLGMSVPATLAWIGFLVWGINQL